MFEVEFDFDESSKIWRKNKIYVGNGSFNYRCNHIYKNKKFVINQFIQILILKTIYIV
jgi:hypothetical protein